MPRTKQIEQPNSGGVKAKLQRFEYREVSRSAINPAPYNPRAISDVARKELRRSLEDFGCVEPLIWNETTGNLVGGHQRLSILDDDEGYPGKDYTVAVAVVKLSPKREKALNVRLNNGASQGHFDKDAFFAFMGEEDAPTLEDMGLTRADLEFEFGELPDIDALIQSERKAADPIKSQVDAIKERKKEAKREDWDNPENDADYALMVIFDSGNAKRLFLESGGFPADVRFLRLEEIRDALSRE